MMPRWGKRPKHLKALEIEDTSDCAACTERERGELELLATVKCSALEGLRCPECGRTFTLLIPKGAADATDAG